MRRLVDRQALKRELDVLAMIGVKAAEHQAIGDGFSLGPAHKEPRSAHQEAPAILSGGAAERLALDGKIGGAAIFCAESLTLALAARAEGRLLKDERGDLRGLALLASLS